MKKLIFAIAAIATITFTSCTGKHTTTETVTTDSTSVSTDSTTVATDSTQVDSVTTK